MIDEFFNGYLKCALWLFDEEPGSGEWDKMHEFEPRLSSEAREKMRADCERFLTLARDILPDNYAQAGHDFWLTRNRHGAGFWDRGHGEIGERLTALAHEFGACDLYRGDDGLIYIG